MIKLSLNSNPKSLVYDFFPDYNTLIISKSQITISPILSEQLWINNIIGAFLSSRTEAIIDIVKQSGKQN
jgi:hypothetical protein